jgi:hypothetical protein
MTFDFGRAFHSLSIDQCRTIGRRGGLRSAKNRRLRRLAEAPDPTPIQPEPERETARQAIERIDRLCPWLIGAERRTTRRMA